jgi:hypothetical protein
MNGPPSHSHSLTTIVIVVIVVRPAQHCCTGLHMLVKQSVFLKLKNMLCSRMLNCCRWSPPPAAAASAATATATANPPARPRRRRAGRLSPLVPAARFPRCRYPAPRPPPIPPARPQPIIRIIGHTLTRHLDPCHPDIECQTFNIERNIRYRRLRYRMHLRYRHFAPSISYVEGVRYRRSHSSISKMTNL